MPRSAANFWCLSILTVRICSRSTVRTKFRQEIINDVKLIFCSLSYTATHSYFLQEQHEVIYLPSRMSSWSSHTSPQDSQNWNNLWYRTPEEYPVNKGIIDTFKRTEMTFKEGIFFSVQCLECKNSESNTLHTQMQQKFHRVTQDMRKEKPVSDHKTTGLDRNEYLLPPFHWEDNHLQRISPHYAHF